MPRKGITCHNHDCTWKEACTQRFQQQQQLQFLYRQQLMTEDHQMILLPTQYKMHIYECVPVHCCTIAWLELIMSKTTSQSKATRTRPLKLKDSDKLSRIQAICSTEILAFAKSFLSKAMPSSI